MSHQNAPGPPIVVPSTQFNLGNGQGNLPSALELTSRDLGRLNPGLSESCNFNLQTSPSYFKVFYHRHRDSPLFYFNHVYFYREEKINDQKYYGIIPRLERRFGHYFVDSFSNGRDSFNNDFMKIIFGLPFFSNKVGQVIMPRGDGRKVILPSQISTVKAIESGPDFSHTTHFHNHFTSVLGHSRNDTVIDWQLKSLVNVLKLLESDFGKPLGDKQFSDDDYSLEILHQELIMLDILVSGSGNLQDKPMQVREYWEMLKCAYQVELGWPFNEDRFDGLMEHKIHFFPDATDRIVRFDRSFPYYFGDPYDNDDDDDDDDESNVSYQFPQISDDSS